MENPAHWSEHKELPICKIENGNYSPKREQVINLASILHTDEKVFLTLWLADKISEITEPEKEIAQDAIDIIMKL